MQSSRSSQEDTSGETELSLEESIQQFNLEYMFLDKLIAALTNQAYLQSITSDNIIQVINEEKESSSFQSLSYLEKNIQNKRLLLTLYDTLEMNAVKQSGDLIEYALIKNERALIKPRIHPEAFQRAYSINVSTLNYREIILLNAVIFDITTSISLLTSLTADPSKAIDKHATRKKELAASAIFKKLAPLDLGMESPLSFKPSDTIIDKLNRLKLRYKQIASTMHLINQLIIFKSDPKLPKFRVNQLSAVIEDLYNTISKETDVDQIKVDVQKKLNDYEQLLGSKKLISSASKKLLQNINRALLYYSNPGKHALLFNSKNQENTLLFEPDAELQLNYK